MRRLVLPALLAAGLCLSTAASADAETYLGCGDRNSLEYADRPSTCFLAWPNLDLAHAVTLRKIKWSGWGSSSARARAAFRVKTYDPYTRVRVRAFGKKQCETYSMYSRVHVSFPNGYEHTWRTPAC